MTIASTSTSAFFDRATIDMASLRAQAEKLQGQVSSGAKLTTSSDDPLAASRLRSLARSDGLGKIDMASSERATVDLNLVDTALNQFTSYTIRAQELTTQAASGTLSTSQRASIGLELAQIHNGLVGIANARDSAGKALFGGDSPGNAYQINGAGNASYIGTGVAGSLSLGDDQSVARSLTGPELLNFNDPAGNPTDLLAVLKSLADTLQAGGAGAAAAASTALGSLANGLDALTTAQTIVGSRLAWIDLSTERQQAMEEARTSEQADIGAPDLASSLARLQQLSTVLEASQRSFSQLASLSLFDLIR